MHVLYKSLAGSGAGAGAGVGAGAGAKEEEKKAISTKAVCTPPGSPSEARLVLMYLFVGREFIEIYACFHMANYELF